MLFSITSRADYLKLIVFHVVLRAETKYYHSKMCLIYIKEIANSIKEKRKHVKSYLKSFV